jgi:UMF1 family MFS transporter
MVQFVGIPFTFAFSCWPRRSHQAAIYLSLLIYTVICIAGYFMSQEWHFWALGFSVAIVQGGSQALSRGLFGRLAPKSKSAEFFGFFSVSEKFAGIVGPFIFGLVGQMMGNSRLAIVSLVIFFIIGATLLSRVNVEEGAKVALLEEKSLHEAAAD